MNNAPFFSVLIAAYNCQSTIADCLTSILNQDFDDFEIIFVNDASTDNTLYLAERILASFEHAYIYSNSVNIGLTASLNVGLLNSRGTYIARLDADDRSLPNRLSNASQLHLKGFDIVGTSAYDSNKFIYSCYMPNARHLPSYSTIRSFITNPYAHSSVSFRRCFLNNSPIFYDPKYLKSQDFELWNRLHSYGLKSCFISSPNCIRSNLVNSISNKYYRSQRFYAFCVRLRYYPFSMLAYYHNLVELFLFFYSLFGLRWIKILIISSHREAKI